jgi:hypothetical protein
MEIGKMKKKGDRYALDLSTSGAICEEIRLAR